MQSGRLQRNTNLLWFIGITCCLIGLIWSLVPHPVVPIALALIPFALFIVVHFSVPIGLLFIVFSFFRIHEAIPVLYSLRIPLLLSLATIATLTWHLVISKKIKPYSRPELRAFFIFFMLVFIGLLFSANRPIAFAYFQSTYIKMAIMVPVLAWILTEVKHFKLTLFMMSCAGLIVGSIAIFNKINGIGLVEETRVTIGRNIQSILGDPNDLSLVLLFPLSFAISLLLTAGLSLKLRLLGFVATIVLFSAIMATQSRGGLLGVIAVVGIVTYRRVKSKTLFFSVGGLCIVALFILAGISGRKSGGAVEAGVDESAMGRVHAWEAAIGMALDNPLTGVGVNTFYSNYYYYTPFWDGLNHAVHSTWFGVLAETGFVGLAAYLIMMTRIFKASRNTLNIVTRRGSKYPAVVRAISEGNFAGLLSFCVSGSFLTQGFTWPIYILLALTASVAQFVDNKEASNDACKDRKIS